MKQEIPVIYKGKKVGFIYEDDKEKNINVTNKELWDTIVEENNKTIGISSRSMGEVNKNNKIEKDEIFEYSILIPISL